jgi:hypothetical protein
MIAASPPPIPEFSGRMAGDGSPKNAPADWTCYSAGAFTTEWVAQAAEDPSAPSDILCMLAASCNVEVRMAVADNLSASLDTLLMLAQDESEDLRYQLAENHNIDKGILNLLAEDSNPYVAHRAQRTLRRLKDSCAIVVYPVLKVARNFSKTGLSA